MVTVFTVPMIFARKSIGSDARIGCRGSWISSGFAEAADETEVDGDCDCEAADIGMGADGAAVPGRNVCTALALSSSKRRNRPRSNPANFDFTALILALGDRPMWQVVMGFSTNRATVCFFYFCRADFDLLELVVKIVPSLDWLAAVLS
jgi:hypothetical protein